MGGCTWCAICLICVWSVTVLLRSYSATTMSFWLHSSGQLSVFTFLQNGIIWQLFLLRLAECRANPLAAPCTAQQIPFVSADLQRPCLLPSIWCSEVNYSTHGSYNNSNQIKVDPRGQLFLCAVISFRLCTSCNVPNCYRL